MDPDGGTARQIQGISGNLILRDVFRRGFVEVGLKIRFGLFSENVHYRKRDLESVALHGGKSERTDFGPGSGLLENDLAFGVDGFHPVNVGNLVIGRKAFLPCTPHGIIVLLETMGIKTDGAHAVVVGRSNIVGKPVSLLLARRETNATVTICHTGTKDLASFTKQADILVAAVGRPKMITADMIKPGAAVIDVGVNRVPDATKKSGFRLVGDVDFENAKEVASYITPVPKGVGPMTIAMLMQNVLEAAQAAAESK